MGTGGAGPAAGLERPKNPSHVEMGDRGVAGCDGASWYTVLPDTDETGRGALGSVGGCSRSREETRRTMPGKLTGGLLSRVGGSAADGPASAWESASARNPSSVGGDIHPGYEIRDVRAGGEDGRALPRVNQLNLPRRPTPLLTFPRSAVKSCALSSCSDSGLSGHNRVSLCGGEPCG